MRQSKFSFLLEHLWFPTLFLLILICISGGLCFGWWGWKTSEPMRILGYCTGFFCVLLAFGWQREYKRACWEYQDKFLNRYRQNIKR